MYLCILHVKLNLVGGKIYNTIQEVMYLCILHVKLDLVGGKIACNTAEILGRKTTHEKNVLMQDALNKHEIYALEN